jgi:tetratricopeptide (TPR) repeat protein
MEFSLVSTNRTAIIVSAMAAIAGSGAIAAVDLPNCVPKDHLQQAMAFRERAVEQFRQRRFDKAAELFQKALTILDYHYQKQVLDDSGLKLSLADYREKKGDFRLAANIRRGILDDRLKMSEEASSPACK